MIIPAKLLSVNLTFALCLVLIIAWCQANMLNKDNKHYTQTLSSQTKIFCESHTAESIAGDLFYLCLSKECQMSLLLFFIKPRFTFTPGSRPVRPHTRAAGLFPFVAQLCPLEQKNLGWDSIKWRCCSQQIPFGESSAFQVFSDTQRETGKKAVAQKKVKMEVVLLRSLQRKKFSE